MLNNLKTIKKLYYNEYIIISIILLLGLFVRLYKINSPIADWHSFRQADTASVSREFVNNGINLFIPKYHDISRVQSGIFNPNGYRFVEFPIFNALHAFLYTNFPVVSFEVVGRLISIICSLVSGVCLYLIAKKLYSKFSGFVAVVLFYILPFNIYFSRVILPEPMAVMFGLLSLYFFINFEKYNNFKHLYISSIFMLLGVLVKPYIIFYTLPMVFHFIGKYGLKSSLTKKEVIIYLAVVLVPFFAWRLWMNNFPSGIPFWKWTFNGDGIRFKPAFWYWIFGERLTKLILGSAGLIPLGIGLLGLKKKDNFLISVTLGALMYVSIFATANVRHDYYQTIIIPVVCLLVAKGYQFIFDNPAVSRRYAITLVSLSVMIGLLNGAFQVKEFYKINHPEIIEAGAAVDRLTPKNSLVIANYNGDTAFLYQTKRRGWPVVELPINELIEEGAQYYVSVNYDSATNEFIKKYKTVEKTSTYILLDLTNTIN